MVKKYTCLQLVILCPERRRLVFVSVCTVSKSHKDTLQILSALCSSKDLNLVGLKSNNCHVLMQKLLSVAIRDILPNKVRLAITRLCLFLNVICSKVLDPVKLDKLENEDAIILC